MLRHFLFFFLSFFCLFCNAQITKCEVEPFGSYVQVTYEHQSACQALLPTEISLCSDNVFRSGTSCTGSVIGTFQEYRDIPLSLENGRTASGNVFAICVGQQYVADFFIDSSSFRSNDFRDPLFTESRFCEITYISLENEARGERHQQSPKNFMEHNVDELNTCEELFESGFSITTYQSGLNCLTSVPFSATRRAEVLEYYRWFFELYVYRDLNINSGGDDPVRLDIFAEFDRIEQFSYTSDFEFQADMSLTFRKMRDSHTLFRNSFCYLGYNSFAFFQPFSLRSRVSVSGAQEIFISELEEGTELLYNFDVGSFRGYIVESIDGVDALQMLIEYANREMPDKDRSVRFNRLLLQDLFTFRDGFSSGIPQSDTMIWRLRSHVDDIVEVTIPWLVLYLRNEDLFPLTSTDEFIAECTLNLKRNMKQSESYFQHRMKRNVVKKDLNSAELVNLPDASLYRLDSTTGVLVVPNFVSTYDFSFVDTISMLYFSAIHRYGFTQLEIDVSRNTGGSSSFGFFLAALLEPVLIDSTQPYDQIHSPIFTDAINFYWNSLNSTEREIFDAETEGLGTFYFGRLLSGGNVPSPRDSWYTPGVQYTRGGRTSSYSRRVELTPQNFTDLKIEITQSIISLAAYYQLPASNLLIITDGTCASTCSFFVRNLRNAPDPVSIVGYGGLVGEHLRTSQVPANIATHSLMSTLFNNLVAFGFSSSALPVPRTPLESGEFAFTLMEAYAEKPGDYYQGKNSPYPIEFTPSPVDFRIFYWPEGIAISGAGSNIWLLAKRYFRSDDLPYKSLDYAYWYPDSSPKEPTPSVAAKQSVTLLLVLLIFCTFF